MTRSEQTALLSPSSMDSRSKTILIVDDSESVRRSVRAVLESQPEWRVCGEAVDGLDAIDKARELRPDLIILDVAMPRMNGLEAASVLRRTMPYVRILLFTMHGDVLGPSPNSTLGFDAALSKPEGIGKLVPCIQTLMGCPGQDVPEPVERPSFEPDYGGLCRARHCTKSAKFQAEWKHVTKLVCEQHKKLVEKKPWSEVAHLFGRTPFSD